MLYALSVLAALLLGWWLGWRACEAKREILDGSTPISEDTCDDLF